MDSETLKGTGVLIFNLAINTLSLFLYAILNSSPISLYSCINVSSILLYIPNVYIYTKEAQGIGTIYDEEIVNKGIELLKEYTNGKESLKISYFF